MFWTGITINILLFGVCHLKFLKKFNSKKCYLYSIAQSTTTFLKLFRRLRFINMVFVYRKNVVHSQNSIAHRYIKRRNSFLILPIFLHSLPTHRLILSKSNKPFFIVREKIDIKSEKKSECKCFSGICRKSQFMFRLWL